MKYDELCERLDIEKNNSDQLEGMADSKDIFMTIKNYEDENAHAYVVVNGVQFQFRTITLGMQEPSDDAWLLFKFIILDDDIDDIIVYKDLAKRLVPTSYYKGIGGFGFRHFVKAILLFLKQEKLSV